MNEFGSANRVQSIEEMNPMDFVKKKAGFCSAVRRGFLRLRVVGAVLWGRMCRRLFGIDC